MAGRFPRVPQVRWRPDLKDAVTQQGAEQQAGQLEEILAGLDRAVIH